MSNWSHYERVRKELDADIKAYKDFNLVEARKAKALGLTIGSVYFNQLMELHCDENFRKHVECDLNKREEQLNKMKAEIIKEDIKTYLQYLWKPFIGGLIIAGSIYVAL